MLGKINKPFFIAEISSNHNGDIINAKKLIYMAKKMVQMQSNCKPIPQKQ